MVMANLHRLAARRRATVATASAASVIVLGGLWFGSGDAAGGEAAAPPDPPLIGTAACDALVDADAAVVAELRDGIDPEALAELRAALAVNLCDLDGATTLDGTLAVDL